jgi:hypothetical protein
MKKVLIVPFLSIATLSAASVTVGTANAVNALPFSDSADGITTYQQVYSSRAFTGSIDIDGISFCLDPLAGNHNQLVPQSVTISLSTTEIPVDGLYYHAPQGPDATTFGTFNIGGTSPNVLTFSAQPFHYDPSVGNLLLEITTPSTSPVSLFTDAYYESDNSGKLTSRYCDETECNENQGLVTEFDFASATVPEPSPLTVRGLTPNNSEAANWDSMLAKHIGSALRKAGRTSGAG